ncbi:hypothetical protein R1flu_020046 [Riccia fluitans]|uniref:Uncharacterized protein n=1 Tax=Riccia fluitans TaxID=41844 RepID=A0ABD1ZKM0_9MARC
MQARKRKEVATNISSKHCEPRATQGRKEPNPTAGVRWCRCLRWDADASSMGDLLSTVWILRWVNRNPHSCAIALILVGSIIWRRAWLDDDGCRGLLLFSKLSDLGCSFPF